MADEKGTDKSTTTTTTGTYIMTLVPDGGSPTGFEDLRIAFDDHHAPIQSQIDDNETDIADHETRITTIEVVVDVTTRASDNSNYQFTVEAGKSLDKITFKRVSGTPSIKLSSVGYTNDDLAPGFTFTPTANNPTRYELSVTDGYFSDTASQTIYVTLTGGAVKTKIYKLTY